MTSANTTAAARISDDPSSGPIPFIDLRAQRRQLGTRIDAAIARVLDHGKYILGPEVRDLEQRLAEFAGAKHAVTCSSGTDALLLILMAWDIGPGDAVYVPAFTFASTAEAVALLGATPVFCDVLEDSFDLDPQSLEAAIASSRAEGLRPRGVIAVDLFGQPADYRRIEPLARTHGLKVLADAAQSFGASLDGRRVGTMGDATAVSFFPAKPLGCYGDGGAVLTDDDGLARAIVSLRVHGKGTDKYDNQRIGLNGRLDTLQAAILLQKLTIFEEEIAARQTVAERYDAALADRVATPCLIDGATSVWAQYTIVTDGRDAVASGLKQQGIPTAIYYPLPLNRQTAYASFPSAPGNTPVCDSLARRVVSLPMHPYLDPATQDRVISALRGALADGSHCFVGR
jgi:dTDP-4-amino-4,6-dideoxygalactose transaminase